jgi:hypothetical protein
MRTHRRGSTGPFGRRSSHLGYDGDRGWLTSGLACRSNWCTRFKSPGLKSQQVYRCTAQTGWTAYLGVVYRERVGGKSRFSLCPALRRFATNTSASSVPVWLPWVRSYTSARMKVNYKQQGTGQKADRKTPWSLWLRPKDTGSGPKSE